MNSLEPFLHGLYFFIRLLSFTRIKNFEIGHNFEGFCVKLERIFSNNRRMIISGVV